MSHEHFGIGKSNEFGSFQQGSNEPENFDMRGPRAGWSNAYDPNQGSRGESFNQDMQGRHEYGAHRGFRHGDQFADEQGGMAKAWKMQPGMNTAEVFQTASAVSQALQDGDIHAARKFASEVDPRSIRAAKMQLYGEMHDAAPGDQQALLQQGRDLRTLQRASLAFDLMRNGEEREGKFLLQHLMHSGKHGHREGRMQAQDPNAQTLDGDPDYSTFQQNPATQSAFDNVNAGNMDQIDPNQTLDGANPGTTTDNAAVTNDLQNPPYGTDLTQTPQYVADGSQNQPVVTDGPQNQPVVTDGSQNQPVVTDDSQNQPVVTDGSQNQPLVTDTTQTTGDVLTSDNTGDQSNTATSPLKTLMALAQQISSGQQTLTPEVKAAFESAIQQADAGQSPILASLQTQYDQQSKQLQGNIPDTAVSSMNALDQQANQQITAIGDPAKQAQATALYSMLDSATSAEDKAAIRQQLLALVPGLDSILTQRDQVTAPFDQQMFSLNSLGQQISGEQNQAAVTRLIYAQVLANSGDTAGASAQLDAAIAKNTDTSMTDYLQQAKQGLSAPATS